MHEDLHVHRAYMIRRAEHSDLKTLVGFSLQEAREAEGAEKSGDDVRRGIEVALRDPAAAIYWVAEAPDRCLVAAISVVTEWSNFHGGRYWWIQSLFIVPEHRGRGLVEQLLDHVAQAAHETGALDLRLYVHQSNHRAVRAYHRCGFRVAPYAIMTRSLKE